MDTRFDATSPISERLHQAEVAALDLYTVYLGQRLGLYRALGDGPATPAQLAERTGTFERYVREWLEHHAVAGFLDVDDPAKPAGDRQYQLPADHADALANQDSLDFGAHKAVDIVRAGRQLPELVEAFRTGRGLPPLAWAPEGRAEFNRPRFVNLLGREWLPAVGELDRRLSSVPPARIADIACGTGWSSIAMAHAYPKVRVDGFDLDEDAIARARENAASEGVEDRVSFEARDAAEVGQSFRYDLATIFEALHDMARPVDALRAARGLLDDTGWGLLLADERVADRFVVPADDRERYVYGWSVVTCLPSAMVDPQSAGTGAVMRPDTVRAYAADAGFAGVETLPIETDYWRFYRLVP